MKYWILAGFFFALFEFTFWQGYKLFHLSGELNLLNGILLMIFSCGWFALFVKMVAWEIVHCIQAEKSIESGE